MPPRRRLASGAIAYIIAALYLVAGQAHFTPLLTPDLAANVEVMTRNSHAAFSFLGLEYITLKSLFGAFDPLGAALLFLRDTRTAGLFTAVIGFSGGLYGQIYSGQDVSQVGGLLSLAVVGLILRLKSY